jgi:hypothetical protein
MSRKFDCGKEKSSTMKQLFGLLLFQVLANNFVNGKFEFALHLIIIKVKSRQISSTEV